MNFKSSLPIVRRRLVATIIDECDTPGNREGYIDAMKKSDLEVQIYGKCGAPCPGHSRADCLKHIDNHYKVNKITIHEQNMWKFCC